MSATWVSAEPPTAAGEHEAGPVQRIGHERHRDRRMPPVSELHLLAVVDVQVTADALAKGSVEADRGVHAGRIPQRPRPPR